MIKGHVVRMLSWPRIEKQDDYRAGQYFGIACLLGLSC